MDQATLKKKLNTIGQGIFVENFSVFQKCYAHKKNDLNGCMMELSKIKADGGAGRCCSAAKAIFHQEKVREALKITANSPYKHMPEKVKAQAQELLDNLPPEIK